MSEPVSFDTVLQQALSGVQNDDVRLFYDYFDELKRHARRHLRGKAQLGQGDSAIVQSALFSLICDAAAQQVPLIDVDEFGYPMLWPLLLKYIERHCNKWNKFYRAKKRQGSVLALDPAAASDDTLAGFDPADYRAEPEEEQRFAAALEAFQARLTEQQRRIVELRLQDKTLAEIAAAMQVSEATVSNRLKQIREQLVAT